MRGFTRRLATAVLIVGAGLTLGACASLPATTAKAVEPVQIEAVGDTGVKRLTLTDRAARLAITTAAVTQDRTAAGAAAGTGRLLMPYSALLYLPDGTTFAYTNPEGHSYVRESVTVESIRGDQAVLAAGPAVGTAVVTTGAAELWGTEFGIK